MDSDKACQQVAVELAFLELPVGVWKCGPSLPVLDPTSAPVGHLPLASFQHQWNVQVDDNQNAVRTLWSSRCYHHFTACQRRYQKASLTLLWSILIMVLSSAGLCVAILPRDSQEMLAA
jgi:hypothetical protein